MTLRGRIRTMRSRSEQLNRSRTLRVRESVQSKHVVSGERTLLSFNSNDYLGLAAHRELIEATHHALKKWGTGNAASQLVSGYTSAHVQLQKDLADFHQAEDCILFSSGYSANVGVLSALLGRHDVCIQDKLNHASLIDGARLATCELSRFKHKNIEDARKKLIKAKLRTQSSRGSVVLCTDAVFSMDGDCADLIALEKLCREFTTPLIIDDAHGVGVLGDAGRGYAARCGIVPQGDVLLTATFGKAFGGMGAYVVGDRLWIDHLRQNARSFIYSTSPPSAGLEAMRLALKLIQKNTLRERLQGLILHFRKEVSRLKLDMVDSDTAIQALLVGENAPCLRLAEQLIDAGFLVTAIRPPTVPEGTARIRITLTAEHHEQDITHLLESCYAFTH
ncbi:MAG: aminotransferase class I/II-fold pyridoxal phosphate-dependent enzyme [bacterium]